MRRAPVAADTPQSRAASRTVSFNSGCGRAAVDRGRPRRFPCIRARCRPARTRSRIRSRSNSAIAPRTCSCSRPAGVVASIPSETVTKATPTACSSSSSRIRCRRFRPSPPLPHQAMERTAVSTARCQGGSVVGGGRLSSGRYPIRGITVGPADRFRVFCKPRDGSSELPLWPFAAYGPPSW